MQNFTQADPLSLAASNVLRGHNRPIELNAQRHTFNVSNHPFATHEYEASSSCQRRRLPFLGEFRLPMIRRLSRTFIALEQGRHKAMLQTWRWRALVWAAALPGILPIIPDGTHMPYHARQDALSHTRLHKTPAKRYEKLCGNHVGVTPSYLIFFSGMVLFGTSTIGVIMAFLGMIRNFSP